jgi:hypothetical protein
MGRRPGATIRYLTGTVPTPHSATQWIPLLLVRSAFARPAFCRSNWNGTSFSMCLFPALVLRQYSQQSTASWTVRPHARPEANDRHYVVIGCNGVEITLAHLAEGSLRVRTGEKIRAAVGSLRPESFAITSAAALPMLMCISIGYIRSVT